MRESEIEAHLVKEVLAKSGLVRKVKWIGRRGAPDRLVLLGDVWLVELKRPGLDAEDYQAREHDRLRKAGARVVTLDTKAKIDQFIEEVTTMDDQALIARLTTGQSIFERCILDLIRRLQDQNQQLATRVAELEKEAPCSLSD